MTIYLWQIRRNVRVKSFFRLRSGKLQCKLATNLGAGACWPRYGCAQVDSTHWHNLWTSFFVLLSLFMYCWSFEEAMHRSLLRPSFLGCDGWKRAGHTSQFCPRFITSAFCVLGLNLNRLYELNGVTSVFTYCMIVEHLGKHTYFLGTEMYVWN